MYGKSENCVVPGSTSVVLRSLTIVVKVETVAGRTDINRDNLGLGWRGVVLIFILGKPICSIVMIARF